MPDRHEGNQVMNRHLALRSCTGCWSACAEEWECWRERGWREKWPSTERNSHLPIELMARSCSPDVLRRDWSSLRLCWPASNQGSFRILRDSHRHDMSYEMGILHSYASSDTVLAV